MNGLITTIYRSETKPNNQNWLWVVINSAKEILDICKYDANFVVTPKYITKYPLYIYDGQNVGSWVSINGYSTSEVNDVTYADLVDLKTTNSLIKGSWYNITDYKTTCLQTDCRVAEIYTDFSIMMLATANNMLDENVRIPEHSNWQVKYCLENDIKYIWNDPINGKGIIYEMLDDNLNKASYDSVNIEFDTNKIKYDIDKAANFKRIDFNTDITDKNIAKTAWLQPYWGVNVLFDGTNITNGTWIEDWKKTFNVSTFSPKSNIIEMYTNYSNLMLPTIELNKIVLEGSVHNTIIYKDCSKIFIYGIHSDNNIINTSCHDIYISEGDLNHIDTNSNMIYLYDNCNNNIIGTECSNLFLKQSCVGNIFNTLNTDIYMNTNCNNNIFGQNCTNNTFGDQCDNNNFSSYCYNNSFGSSCHDNTIGQIFHDNTIGNNFFENIVKTNCYTNTFGNDCYDNNIEIGFIKNTIGNKFEGNNIGIIFYDNTIGDVFKFNTTKSRLFTNTFGNNTEFNTIDDAFQNNNIGNLFVHNNINEFAQLNVIGDNFNRNTIGYQFKGNNVGDNFRANTIDVHCEFCIFPINISKLIISKSIRNILGAELDFTPFTQLQNKEYEQYIIKSNTAQVYTRYFDDDTEDYQTTKLIGLITA